tara:strand:+ start:4061 stop:4987 length:927 start_codon:yes stop_codon:yes gene_type:complete
MAIDYNPLYASIAATSQNMGNAAFDAGYFIPEMIRESKNIINKAKDSIGNFAKDKKNKKKESTQMAQGQGGGWFPGKHLAGAIGGAAGGIKNMMSQENPFTNQSGLFQGGAQGRPMGRFRDQMEGSFQNKAGGGEMSFSDAFAQARSQGLGEFNWQGKPYHTKTKEEMDSNPTSGTVGPGAGAGGPGGGNLGPFHPSNRGSLGENMKKNADNIGNLGSGREGFIPDWLQGKEGFIPDWLQGREGFIPDALQGKGTSGPGLGLLGAVQGGMGNQENGGEGMMPDYLQGEEGWVPDYFQGKEGFIPDWLY